MIGSGLKKLAQEYGMGVDKGVGYGNLGGFAATLSEGAGTKQIVFTTIFPDPGKRMEFIDRIQTVDVKKLYRVTTLNVEKDGIVVIFHDDPGTMKKLRAFLDWFLPLLREYGASPWNICTVCGFEIPEGKWVLIGGAAFYVHEACAENLRREVEADNEQRSQSEGNYLMGLLGALLGAALGAVVWALVLYMGYVASIVGLLIGWLAEKGYNLLKGKQGKAKVWILVLAVIFGVLLGTFASDAMTLAMMISEGEMPGFTLGEIPWFILYLLQIDEEYRGATISNTLMGLFFAALGVYGVLRKAGKETADTKYAELN